MQGTLDRCPEFNTKSNLMVILSLSLIHFLQIPSLGTKWDELVWIWSIVQLLWSVTKSPICFPYWSRAYFFICTMRSLRESGQIPWIFIHCATSLYAFPQWSSSNFFIFSLVVSSIWTICPRYSSHVMWIPSLTKFASILNFHPMCNFWKFKCILNKQTIDGNR